MILIVISLAITIPFLSHNASKVHTITMFVTADLYYENQSTSSEVARWHTCTQR